MHNFKHAFNMNPIPYKKKGFFSKSFYIINRFEILSMKYEKTDKKTSTLNSIEGTVLIKILFCEVFQVWLII